jgi:isoleucyl-tRNA synthetase
LVANSNGITVALDITISSELKTRGIARELVTRISVKILDLSYEKKSSVERNGI